MRPACPIRAAAAARPEALALRAPGRELTYAGLESEVSAFGAWLHSRGVGAGDRVALLSNNRWELVPLLFAIWREQAVAVLLNARLTAAELAPQLERAGPKLRIAEAALRDRMPGSEELVAPDPALGRRQAQAKRTTGQAERSRSRSDAPSPDALAAILFTSGTTGRAKAAALTWGNFLANAEASAKNIGGAPSDRWLLCLPLFHIGGLSMVVRAAQYQCALVLHPRFDAEAVSRSFDQDAITHASLVPTGLRRVVDHRGDRRFPDSVQAILIGGGPVPLDLLHRARGLGAPVLQTYGLTEATSQVTTERPAEADGTTAGHPLPGTQVRIVDGSGATLPPGEVGEIEVQGPTVMKGYFGDESETHQTLWKGWLRTKDLGTLDERGRLRVFARRTDLIVTGGENVYPAEVEAALLAQPGVDDAAVIGVDDPQWGQRVVAAVVAPEATDEQLKEGCRQRLAGYKLPSQFLRLRELPRNAGGKVDREALRRLLHKPLTTTGG